MTRRRFIFDGPDRFVPGTVGEPGDRSFFLQARKGRTLVSVGIEKVQVAALADRLETLLDAVDVADAADVAGVADVPALAESTHEMSLEQPVVELFRVGALALAWDAGRASVVIEAQTPTDGGEYAELPDDAEEGPDVLRVRIQPSAARAFVRRAEELLGAGRPACPFCGQPLDPRGHFCQQANATLN